MSCSKTTLVSSRATPTMSSTLSWRKCSGGIRTSGSGAKRAARPSPAQTKPNPPKREGGPNAKNTRIARLHLGHPRNGHRSVPVLHAPVPGRADLSARHQSARSPRFLELQIPLLRIPFHHALPGLLDGAFGPLHFYPESTSHHLPRTPSPISRSK